MLLGHLSHGKKKEANLCYFVFQPLYSLVPSELLWGKTEVNKTQNKNSKVTFLDYFDISTQEIILDIKVKSHRYPDPVLGKRTERVTTGYGRLEVLGRGRVVSPSVHW